MHYNVRGCYSCNENNCLVSQSANPSAELLLDRVKLGIQQYSARVYLNYPQQQFGHPVTPVARHRVGPLLLLRLLRLLQLRERQKAPQNQLVFGSSEASAARRRRCLTYTTDCSSGLNPSIERVGALLRIGLWAAQVAFLSSFRALQIEVSVSFCVKPPPFQDFR